MSKIPESDRHLEVMINCKTYPAVSKKYLETVCTGGIAADGSFARLYPIPYRFLEEQEQYERWDIVRVSVYRDTKDPRPESWHLDVGAPIEVIGRAKSEETKWSWMRNGVFESTAEMESKGLTNGLVEIEPGEIYWEPETKRWTPSQLDVLTQGQLFLDKSRMSELAERVPWQFKLRFTEKHTGEVFDRKLLAWSYYQGYRRFYRETGDQQAALQMVRDRIYQSIRSEDRTVFAILGTHSRFKHWMISALYHVPNRVCNHPMLF